MPRYIDADKLMSNAVIPLVKSASLRNRNLYSAVKRVANEIELAPTEDVAPVVHAHWVVDRYCSHCDCDIHDYEMYSKLPKYCPECGADMRGEQNDL